MVKVFDHEFLYSSLIPFMKVFSHDVLLNIVEKTKQTYVLPFFQKCYLSMIANFDLSMSKGAHNVFALVLFS